MSWGEYNYVETRFVKGLNTVEEPHTLDRDTGELPDVMNMTMRTQGLRTRHGWLPASELEAEYSALPSNVPVGLFLFEPAQGDADEPAESPEPEPEQETEPASGGDDGDGGMDTTPYSHANTTQNGNGRIRPQPKPSPSPSPSPIDPEKESSSWSASISGGPVMPYVPFSVTVNGPEIPSYERAELIPGQKAAGLRMAACSGASPWTRPAMVEELSRSATQLRLASGSPSGYAIATASYALYSFVPDLPATVTPGEWIEYTVSCKKSGSVVSAYEGGGRGMSFTVYLEDADGNRIEGGFEDGGSSWHSGVLTGRVRFDPGVSGSSVVLQTSFLGETLTDRASLLPVDGVVQAPSSLHVFGPAKTLRMYDMGESSAGLSVSLAYDPSSTAVLRDSSGEEIDWSAWEWTGDSWRFEKDVEAVGSGSGSVTLTLLKDGGAAAASATITINAALTATITGASSVTAGEEYSLGIAIGASGESSLPRFTPSAVSVAIFDENGQDVTQQVSGADFSDAKWDGTGWSHDVIFPTAGVTWTVKVFQGGTLLSSKAIEVNAAPGEIIAILIEGDVAWAGTYVKQETAWKDKPWFLGNNKCYYYWGPDAPFQLPGTPAYVVSQYGQTTPSYGPVPIDFIAGSTDLPYGTLDSGATASAVYDDDEES